jgi:signal transduction histidine kinase
MTQHNTSVPPVDSLQARICELEQEKNELQLLLERNKAREAKGNFLHLLSHELRTPLTSVNGALELLKEVEIGPLNDSQVEFLGVAINNTHRIINMVETLFEIARFENGLLKIEKQPVNLKSLLETVLYAGLRTAFEAKNIELSLEVPTGLLVEADARRLYQVFEHLLSNACKFTPCKGTVTVKAIPHANKIKISIQDSGPGLRQEILSYLSAKTFRVEEFLSRDLNCSGLGLTITTCLLTLHRTRLRVENLAEGGAAFSFELPATTPNTL